MLCRNMVLQVSAWDLRIKKALEWRYLEWFGFCIDFLNRHQGVKVESSSLYYFSGLQQFKLLYYGERSCDKTTWSIFDRTSSNSLMSLQIIGFIKVFVIVLKTFWTVFSFRCILYLFNLVANLFKEFSRSLINVCLENIWKQIVFLKRFLPGLTVNEVAVIKPKDSAIGDNCLAEESWIMYYLQTVLVGHSLMISWSLLKKYWGLASVF